MTADREPGPMKPHHFEAIGGDRHLRRCRAAGVEPVLGLAMDLAPLNRGVKHVTEAPGQIGMRYLADVPADEALDNRDQLPFHQGQLAPKPRR